MHIIYVYEKVKIWSNYIFPFKYKKCFQGCKKCTVVKQVVNKDLYKNLIKNGKKIKKIKIKKSEL